MTHDVILILAFSVLRSLGTGLVFSPILFNVQTHLLNLDVLLSSSKLSDPQSFWCKTRKKNDDKMYCFIYISRYLQFSNHHNYISFSHFQSRKKIYFNSDAFLKLNFLQKMWGEYFIEWIMNDILELIFEFRKKLFLPAHA